MPIYSVPEWLARMYTKKYSGVIEIFHSVRSFKYNVKMLINRTEDAH
jgi:hypothetical protein